MSLSVTDIFDASAPWSLDANVSVRDEAFGALAYHHVNRRLVFLKSKGLVDLVRRLDEFDSAAEAIDALVPVRQRANYARALSSLAASGIICGR